MSNSIQTISSFPPINVVTALTYQLFEKNHPGLSLYRGFSVQNLTKKEDFFVFKKASQYVLDFNKKIDLTKKEVVLTLGSYLSENGSSSKIVYDVGIKLKRIDEATSAVFFKIAEKIVPTPAAGKSTTFQFSLKMIDRENETETEFHSENFHITYHLMKLIPDEEKSYLSFYEVFPHRNPIPNELYSNRAQTLNLDRAKHLITRHLSQPVIGIALTAARQLLHEPLEFRRRLNLFCSLISHLSKERLLEIFFNSNKICHTYSTYNLHELAHLEFVSDFISLHPNNDLIRKAIEIAIIGHNADFALQKDYPELCRIIEQSSWEEIEILFIFYHSMKNFLDLTMLSK